MPAALSICIPTHDGRARELDRLLESIARQWDGLPGGVVEVCISDNGSQDATQDVLARHAERFGDALVMSRFPDDRGFTANLLQAVALGQGGHCWLMGSDDEIEPGGVGTVLDILARHPDRSGLTLNRRNVDDEDPTIVVLDDPRVLPPPGRITYDRAEDVFGELAMLQDYISTQVIRRERWKAAVDELGPEGLAAGRLFPHLVVLGTMIRADPRWAWVATPLVRHRVGRESVKAAVPDGGMTQYTLTVTAQRAAIWARMFGRRSPLYRRAMGNIWLVQANPAILADYKADPAQTYALDVRLLVSLTRYYWFLPAFWRHSLPVLALPHPLAGLLRRLKG